MSRPAAETQLPERHPMGRGVGNHGRPPSEKVCPLIGMQFVDKNREKYENNILKKTVLNVSGTAQFFSTDMMDDIVLQNTLVTAP